MAREHVCVERNLDLSSASDYAPTMRRLEDVARPATVDRERLSRSMGQAHLHGLDDLVRKCRPHARADSATGAALPAAIAPVAP